MSGIWCKIMKSCFFIGHRDTSEKVYQPLCEAIEACIADGTNEFIVGQYGDFDRLAARALIQAKRKHPEIRLMLLTPYHPAERETSLPEYFDEIIYPDGLESVPRRYAIARANRYMIDCVDYLIAYVTHPASNAYNLLEYAMKRAEKTELNIVNIAVDFA